MSVPGMRLVLVEWVDSRGVSQGWEELDDMKKREFCVVRSAGWLFQNTDEFIQIVPHMGTNPDQGCGDMVIPRSAVLSVTDLVPAAKK